MAPVHRRIDVAGCELQTLRLVEIVASRGTHRVKEGSHRHIVTPQRGPWYGGDAASTKAVVPETGRLAMDLVRPDQIHR
jgi:hypothetical protein